MSVELFLEKIGKRCKEHADKFSSWEELMTMKTREMKAKGISVSQRKWIRRWVGKYKLGIEPFSIRFKSTARKNKLLKKEANAKHKQLMQNNEQKRKEFYSELRQQRSKLRQASIQNPNSTPNTSSKTVNSNP